MEHTPNAIRGKKGFQTIPLAERFWARVKKTDTCWLWQGETGDGYGRIAENGRKRLAHHVSLALAGRTIPDGLEIDHLCRVRSCVRPDHLEAVTHRENNLRGDNRKRSQTHCLRGHSLSGANVYTTPGTTKRACRACRLFRERRRTRNAIEEAKK